MSTATALKGSSFTLSVLHLSDNKVANIVDFVKEKVTRAPAFFSGAPVVINISKVEQDIDFSSLRQGIQTAGLIPVGVTGCKNKRTQDLAAAAGFAIMSASNTPLQAPVEPAPVKIIRHPVRSGQQVYAKNGDLVVLNHVSAGAEVIADGSIHVYGTLRGRAIAGASGQKTAHVLCQDLQAELVSIAGNYWLSEQIPSEFWQKKAIISMVNNALDIEIIEI